MTHDRFPNPDEGPSLEDVIRKFEAIKQVDIMTYEVAARAAKTFLFQAVEHNVASILDEQPVSRPCRVRGVFFIPLLGPDDSANCSVEFRDYDPIGAEDSTRSIMLGAKSLPLLFPNRKNPEVQGDVFLECATDGRTALRMIDLQSGEVALTDDEQAKAHRDLLQRINAAVAHAAQE